MSDSEQTELLVAFRALAIMQHQVAAEGKALLEAIENLAPRERNAIKQFQLASAQCLGQLNGYTLKTLDDIATHVTSTFRQKKAAQNLQGGEAAQCIYGQFERYDTSKDGVLQIEEFKQAFEGITKTSVTDEEVSTVMDYVDVNKNGKIDIHEFVVWLYGGQNIDEMQDVDSLKAKLKAAELELHAKSAALDRLETEHEFEMDATHDFWKNAAKHAVVTIDQRVDLESAELLGNGRYGFVLKAKRRRDKRDVVVKMMGIRWAHVAVQEWQSGTLVKHENIVEYEEVMLHNDNDMSIETLLRAGYESGALKSKSKRSTFPDRYICLTQELMNRGTVQDWLDSEVLLPGGLFVIMQKVACALAYMHSNDVTHNDIKPENIMLHEETKDGVPIVKLGDLGLATKSKQVAAKNNDFWQYGMTAFCMTSGEKWATRKYHAEDISAICEELSALVKTSGSEGKVLATFMDLPVLLAKVFPAQIDFAEVESWESLQGWGFFEGGDAVDATPTTNAISCARHRKEDHAKIHELERMVKVHCCEKMN